MRLRILLILLSGAAFAQGAVRPPPPPRPASYSPTTAVPVTPGYGVPPSAQPPRGTDKRALPPTKEPGIWAADKPDDNPGVTVSVTIAGVPFDVLAVGPSDISATLAKKCAAEVNLSALGNRDLMSLLHALSDKERACAAALAYAECIVQKKTAVLADAGAAETDDTVLAYGVTVALGVARAHAEAACEGGGGTGKAREAYSKWMRIPAKERPQ